MTNEALLFAVQLGSAGRGPVGIVMLNHSLPLAVSRWAPSGEDDGFSACWSATADIEEFFAAIGLSGGIEDYSDEGLTHWFARGDGEVPAGCEPLCARCGLTRRQHRARYSNGLWVYEVTYSDEDVTDETDDGEWPWLCGGALRRLTPEEAARIGEGKAPWERGVWL